jgi:hypothetical protein
MPAKFASPEEPAHFPRVGDAAARHRLWEGSATPIERCVVPLATRSETDPWKACAQAYRAVGPPR